VKVIYTGSDPRPLDQKPEYRARWMITSSTEQRFSSELGGLNLLRSAIRRSRSSRRGRRRFLISRRKRARMAALTASGISVMSPLQSADRSRAEAGTFINLRASAFGSAQTRRLANYASALTVQLRSYSVDCNCLQRRRCMCSSPTCNLGLIDQHARSAMRDRTRSLRNSARLY
jgi:hypothetical protein